MTNTFMIAALAIAGGTFSYVTGIWPRRSASSGTSQKPRKVRTSERPAESKGQPSFGRR